MSDIVLMDGGMGQELIRLSSNPIHPLWSTWVLVQEPEIVRAVHRAYAEAGARVLTISSYTVTPPRLAAAGIEDEFERLQTAACRLAAEAREEAGRPGVRIAGCLPPLIASYRPDLNPPHDDAVAHYRRIAEAVAPHVDLLLCETMSSAAEARAAATAACETGLETWVSWTLADGGRLHLRSGESLATAAEAIADLPTAARLVNCSHPESLTAAMPDLAALGGPVGGYANAFEGIAELAPGGTVAALRARRDLGPEEYATRALRWVEQGATILGGCCETGPAHIAEIAARLEAAGHRVTGTLSQPGEAA